MTTKNTKRDAVDDILIGGMVVSGLSLALIVSVAWPAAYVVTMLALAFVTILGGTIVVAGGLFNGNLLDFILAECVIKSGIELLGVIAKCMVSVLAASAGSSD